MEYAVSDGLDKMSVVSQGARPQIGAAIALITVIPLLVIAYLFLGGSVYDSDNVWPSIIIIVIVILTLSLTLTLIVTLILILILILMLILIQQKTIMVTVIVMVI